MSAFGVPITAETVEALPRYSGKQQITQEDCARVAMSWIHADDKNLKALKHALELKSAYGVGGCAMVLVYNATGDTLELVDQKNWDDSGVYHETPPASFKNGQWIAFLHANTSNFSSKEGARVYRGRNIEGEVRDYMVAWSVPWSDNANCAYTEVREKDHFKSYSKEDYLPKGRGLIHWDETDQYCASTISIGGYTSAECIAVLRHKYSPLPAENE